MTELVEQVKRNPILVTLVIQLALFSWMASAFNSRVEAIEIKASGIAAIRDDIIDIKVNTTNLMKQVDRLLDHVLKQNGSGRGR